MNLIHLHQGGGTVPGMQFHDQATRFDGRVGLGEGFGFFDGRDIEDVDASDVAIIQEGAGEGELSGFGQATDVIEVGALEGGSFKGVLAAVGAGFEESHDVLAHAVIIGAKGFG